MPSSFDDLSRPPLDAIRLSHALVTDSSIYHDVVVVDATGSTNSDVADLARSGAPAGLVLVAEHQQGGKGRLGRPWQTPARAALTFSILLRPEAPPGRWPWLPLLAGIAVAEALVRAAELDAVLKWPNDVMIHDRKVAGLLAERIETPTGAAVVLGIGVNVSTTRAELPVPEATSMLIEGATTTDRAVILRAIGRTFGALFQAWESAGRTNGAAPEATNGLADSYRARCSTIGRQVRVELPSGAHVSGRCVDVDDGGHLVVESDSGRQTFAAGDVVHVRPQGEFT